jgi:hypothetical protein
MKKIRIGSGSGWWGDRIEPAKWNAERGQIDYLVFETMAEATVSMAQVKLRKDADFKGYDSNLEERFRAVLPICAEKGIKIISNQGWVNPSAACKKILELAKEVGISKLKVAAVEGGHVTEYIKDQNIKLLENGLSVSEIEGNLVSAEAYVGADSIVTALQNGADIVITSRVADPSLFLAPMMYEFNWSASDWNTLAAGSAVGHLLECGAQVTGGYFSDPGYKDVPEPWNLAFPIAEVNDNGEAVLSKVDGTGGELSLRTCKEQMLYEVHDPANYITPDVIVDFTTSKLEQLGKNEVKISNVTGKPHTDSYKVSVGFTEGYVGEDTFYFAGPGAVSKAKLAKEILEQRFGLAKLDAEDFRIDFIGLNAIHGNLSPMYPEPYEVGVRVVARTRTKKEADKVGREVDSMAVCGLASTGKSVPHKERVREVIGIWSCLIPRSVVHPYVTYWGDAQ